MAITTYSELQTAIADFLARTDLTNDIKNFISLAEARMSRELSTRSQEKRVTASTVADDEFISLPTDLREIRVIKLNSSPQRVLRSIIHLNNSTNSSPMLQAASPKHIQLLELRLHCALFRQPPKPSK